MTDREFLISQYADGTISEADRVAVDALLAEDAGARQLLAEEQRLTEYLRASSPSMGAVQWDALAESISSAVSEAEEPARSYRLIPRWGPARLALAASLLIASGVGLSVYLSNHSRTTPPPNQEVAVAKPVLIVTGPLAEAAPNGLAEVSIGPAHQVAGAPDVSLYSSDLVTRPSRLVIASGINPPSSADPSSLPY